MYTAYAIGGPRDKVKLTCPADWDGRIRIPTKVEQPVKVPWYPGRYVWAAAWWVWQEEPEAPQNTRYACGGYHIGTRSPRV